MINEKGGYLLVLKRKLDKAREQVRVLSRKYNAVRKENRLLRDQLQVAKKQMVR